jgi:hypothetical protein
MIMDKHRQVLGILNIIWGSFGVLGAVIVTLVFGGVVGVIRFAAIRDPDAFVAIPIVSLIGTIIICIILVTSLPSLISGIGLLRGASWARLLTIIVSALHVFNIPIGTALGMYGLWVMFSEENRSTMPPSPSVPPINI